MAKKGKKVEEVVEELKDEGMDVEVVSEPAPALLEVEEPKEEIEEPKEEKKGGKREIITHWTGQTGYMTEDNDFVPL
tara:strand:+ start:2019 stop:2249 length:231 start_codon:yes stop_codon:yes gene_type:complete